MGPRILIGVALAIMLGPAHAFAQFVRESDVKSVAGVIGGTAPPEIVYTFMSSGGEILFASLDGEAYKVASAEHEGEGEITPSAEGGGCSEDEGGPVRFCLQVIDASNIALCSSTRPAPPPGWQRDPRFACVLPVAGQPVVYRLRVSAALEGACTPPGMAVQTPQTYPFLLNISLRTIAPPGSSLPQAAARSRNHF